MMAIARLPLRVPKPVLALAVLATLDGATTHLGLALGATEANPLLAALYAAHPLLGESFRLCLWALALGAFWRARGDLSCSRRWLGFCEGLAIGALTFVVAFNTAQLVIVRAVLWWLGP